MKMIRVIIERHCKPDKEAELEKLLVELRARAMKQPGYVSGETLRSVDDPCHWLVISTWVDVDRWKVWEAMPERLEIGSRIEPLLSAQRKISIFGFATRGTGESAHTIDK
jgi:quinol monooxygenase YgiN